MAKIDELEHYRVAYTLVFKLRKAEEYTDKGNWVSTDDVEKELGVFD